MQPVIDSIRDYPPRSQVWWAVSIFAIAAVLSLSTVVAPATAICCLLFYIAARAVRRNKIAIA
jgi:hypothetical protein